MTIISFFRPSPCLIDKNTYYKLVLASTCHQLISHGGGRMATYLVETCGMPEDIYRCVLGS